MRPTDADRELDSFVLVGTQHAAVVDFSPPLGVWGMPIVRPEIRVKTSGEGVRAADCRRPNNPIGAASIEA